MFRSSLLRGSLPKEWKKAKVIPIPKSGSTDNVANYRPVSITSTCSKLLEHIVSKHLLSYINEHNLLSNWQHGFWQGLSTTSQLIELVHDLSENINCRGQTDMIFMDFAKAFDKVSHCKLVRKIDVMFQNPAITNWFSCYFHSREQYV